MARAAVTYEQVAAIANVLYAQGGKDPGTKAIREELSKRAGPNGATGSPNTIQRHLDQWRLRDRPVDQAEAPQLPPQLAGDILRALNAAAAVAREKVEERLRQVQSELDELASTGEANEARIEELASEVASRTSERDSMAGQLAERTKEAAETKTTLASTQEKLAALARELHAAQAEAQAANGRVDEIRQSTDRQLSKMHTELDHARTGQSEAERRSVEAEKQTVAAKAYLDGERAAKVALETRVSELQAAVKHLEQDASRATAAEAAAAGMRAQVVLLNDTMGMLRGMLQKAGTNLPSEPSTGADATVYRRK